MTSNSKIVILLLVLGTAHPVFAQIIDSIPAKEFAQRRARVLQLMPDSSVAIFAAASQKTRLNDIEYEYRQDNNVFYLSGITEQNVVLVLSKRGFAVDSTLVNEILFIPGSDSHSRRYLGETLSMSEAQNDFGFKTVKFYQDFAVTIDSILTGQKKLFYAFPEEFFYEIVSNERYFIAQKTKKLLKEKFDSLRVSSPNKMLARLRQIKSSAEIALLEKTIDITCDAHLAAMRAARPGLYEYQLEAIVEFIFKSLGAEYPAFPSIIGSGPNSTILHHWKNRRQIADGDLIVMDVGAEYRGYSADVTRTIPATGKFSKAQREIYEIVLQAQKEAIAAIKPGIPFLHIHEVAKQVIAEAGYDRYFIHGTSHYLGLDTHDVGDRNASLQPGMVFTVEPGIYIREGAETDPKYWNIGIRIEDDILVTEDGYKVLSDKAPREIANIEKLMKERSDLTLRE